MSKTLNKNVYASPDNWKFFGFRFFFHLLQNFFGYLCRAIILKEQPFTKMPYRFIATQILRIPKKKVCSTYRCNCKTQNVFAYEINASCKHCLCQLQKYQSTYKENSSGLNIHNDKMFSHLA